MGIGLFQLITSALLPVILAVLFQYAESRTKFTEKSYWQKQTVIGICFGILAILSTEFSIEIGGAAINVRDAAPLTAGLIFGGPAGIIAGLIGGIERWFAALWGVGVYTRLACSLATVLAGILAAGVRRFLLDNKKASWAYGLAVGITMEVLHMLLIFLTNMEDLHHAFDLVKGCALPMIAANGLSVMLSAWFVNRIGKKRVSSSAGTKKIAQTFQLWLFACVFIGFIVTCIFTFVIQNRLAKSNAEDLFQINTQDVRNEIEDASAKKLLELTHAIAKEVHVNADKDWLTSLAYHYNVSEINLVNPEGIIVASTFEDFVGFDMASGEQSAYFLPLLDGKTEMVQSYQPTTYDIMVSRKYAAVAIEDGYFVQVGYDAKRYQKDVDEEIKDAAKNRHIGQGGSIIVCDVGWKVVSDRNGNEGSKLLEIGQLITDENIKENTIFVADILGASSYCMYEQSEGYYIISMLPLEEALFSRQVAVYVLVFMEILVFAAVFAYIYFLIKKLIVENIQKVNATLAQITGGNLNVTVDVRSNEEFASLSDDINATVVTLKHYIAEAAARIDAELEFARSIQLGAMPSVFPPFPHRKDFDIFALIDTAKEVGGDFYDFYMLNDHTLAFLAADVSGKGIPAAMFMMTSKTLIKSLAESGLDPAEVFTEANETLCEGNDANMFVTAWLGYIDLQTGKLTYANAGHNPPLVKHRNGSFEYLKGRANFVLAGMEGVRYRKQEMMLHPGDYVYLYTDGVTEAHDKEQQLFGEDRLLVSLNEGKELSVEELCKKVKRDVDAYAGDMEQFDDMTMLAVQVHSLANTSVIEVTPNADSLEMVSEFLDEKFVSLELPMKVASKLKIAADEIFSNIVYYSQANRAEVECGFVEDRLFMIFADDGRPYNPLDAETPDTESSADDRPIGGLGIMIVKNLMDNVDYRYEDGCNKLRLEMEISRA